MGEVRVALSVIGVASALLGLVLLFAVILHQLGDIGTAYLAVGILGWGGPIAATGLSGAAAGRFGSGERRIVRILRSRRS